jgi:hypothetical protein
LLAIFSIVLAHSSALAGTSPSVEVIGPVGGSIGVPVSGVSQSFADITGLSSLMDTAQTIITASLQTLQVAEPPAPGDAPVDHPGPGDHPGPDDHPGPGDHPSPCDHPNPPPVCTVSPTR